MLALNLHLILTLLFAGMGGFMAFQSLQNIVRIYHCTAIESFICALWSPISTRPAPTPCLWSDISSSASAKLAAESLPEN
ncbi:hypothetical protein BJ322DRAFT_1045960 [Thelephora terrestris]|uniref:Secreted protein n=1 Tax=Thelephora terrestris TaxID=56493 RepID=A0A9P6HIK8_9AGAM|nr:hypothetical protein BJ322DRAFT_1045960 [Thelephora terrestris]